MTYDEARREANNLKTLPFYPGEDGLNAVAHDLVEWCQGFQGWSPEQQAMWIVQQIRNTWDRWHGSKLMREIFEQKFTIHPPDPMDRWKQEETPASQFARKNAEAYNRYTAENDAIMKHALEFEKSRDEKNRKVRVFLAVRDFMRVDFPQRWWAERELGYPLTRLQNEEVEAWLSVTPEPHVIHKPGPGITA